MLEQFFLFDRTSVSLPDQQVIDPTNRLAGGIVDFDDDLIDLRPVAIRDAPDDVQLAFFGINFEKIDPVDLIFADDVRHRCQGALVGTAAKPVDGELIDIFLQGFVGDRSGVEHVANDRLDSLAVLGFTGMKAGENRGILIEGKSRGALPVRDAEIKDLGAGTVGVAVRLQEVIRDRGGLEGVNPWVPAAAHYEKGKQADVGPNVDHGGTVGQAYTVLQITFVPKDLLVHVVRFILVQMNDFEAIRQNASLALPEALLGSLFVEGQDTISFGSGPLLQLQQDNVDPVAIAAKRALRLQQLLKNLIVGRKFDVGLKAEMRRPELQGILERLCRKVGGDYKARRRVFLEGIRVVQKGEGDSGEFQVRFARRAEDPNIADHALALSFSLRQQRGMAPQGIGKIEVRYLDTFNRPQYESPAPGHHEGRHYLSHRIQQGGVQAVWLAFRTPPGKSRERVIARPPNRGDTLKPGPVLVAVVT